ncbi:MAG: zinc ribbon domain-containing protein, partial [Oscillospiraceae bacterium]|nr:zinc ribbon domain-containing protein [Oscillospiraceae bacterium]
PKASAGGWTCPTCGKSDNTGKFCSECGTKKPEDQSWFCPECGHKNTGKFCPECGTPRP